MAVVANYVWDSMPMVRCVLHVCCIIVCLLHTGGCLWSVLQGTHRVLQGTRLPVVCTTGYSQGTAGHEVACGLYYRVLTGYCRALGCMCSVLQGTHRVLQGTCRVLTSAWQDMLRLRAAPKADPNPTPPDVGHSTRECSTL